MRYRWDGFDLDREGTLLTRQGEQVDVSKKTLDCINHLIEQRHRVVGYDELIQKIWGHSDVTNHQLSQVVLSARRVLGDDGHNQKLIRTLSGLGYRWVAPVIEGDDTDAPAVRSSAVAVAPIAPSVAEASVATTDVAINDESDAEDTTVPIDIPARKTTISADNGEPRVVTSAADAGQQKRNTPSRLLPAILLMAGLGLALVAWRSISTRQTLDPKLATTASALPAADVDPVARIWKAIEAGKLEEARAALARLPPSVARTPDAMLAGIRLDIQRGRFENAQKNIDEQLRRAKAAEDPVWLARASILNNMLSINEKKTATELLAATQATMDLIDSAGVNLAPGELALAFKTRGGAFLRLGRYDDAMRDYTKSQKLYIEAGAYAKAASLRGSLARVWMRSGRLREALEELRLVKKEVEKQGDYLLTNLTLNTISRVEIELLHTADALSSIAESLRLLKKIEATNRRARTLQLSVFVLACNGRLHEAGANLEEVQQLLRDQDGDSPVLTAFYYLESGEMKRAMESSMREIEAPLLDYETNLLLEDKEGAALIWMTAAQALNSQQGTMPTVPAPMRKIIETPQTSVGHIARGRWLWLRGELQEAEAEFRLAMQETRRANQTFRMTLTGEALAPFLLQRGDLVGAQTLLEDLRAYAPTYIEQDYRTSLIALRIAIAEGDASKVRVAYAHTQSLKGERRLPADVERSYRAISGGSPI